MSPHSPSYVSDMILDSFLCVGTSRNHSLLDKRSAHLQNLDRVLSESAASPQTRGLRGCKLLADEGASHPTRRRGARDHGFMQLPFRSLDPVYVVQHLKVL